MIDTKEVRVSRDSNHVVLEPIARDPAEVAAVFDEIDRLVSDLPLAEPKEVEDPPALPDRRQFFDE